MSLRYQHIIIGAGHNGLVCATVLARRGRSVLVVEASDHVGGMAITREFAPGFKVSACAHLLHALPASLIRELDLARHGLDFAAKRMPTYALNADGPPVVIDGTSVTGVSPADTQAFAKFTRETARFAGVIAGVLAVEPFGLSLASWRERLTALRLGLRVRLLGKRAMREFLRIVGMNAYDLLADNFESTLLKGALAFDATLGAEHGARSPGTVLTLLHRRAGLSHTGAAGLAQPFGGMGAVSDALAAAARAAGVEIRTNSAVKKILVTGDRASGVVLQTGESIEADSVISSADPKTTFLKLLGARYLDTDFVRRVDHFRSKGVVAKLHLALDGAPVFTGIDVTGQAARMIISPSMDYLELAFNPSKYRQIPEHPALEISMPSFNDPALAPAGKHVMSVNILFVPYDMGPDEAEARKALLENVIATLERHAPGIRGRILASELLTPRDLEREFGVAGGHWHHGAMSFDQFFFTRPVPGASNYATPLAGLYLCGAGSHPGGGVMGLAGRNAAHKVIQGGN